MHSEGHVTQFCASSQLCTVRCQPSLATVGARSVAALAVKVFVILALFFFRLRVCACVFCSARLLIALGKQTERH